VAERNIPKRLILRGAVKQDAQIALNNTVINELVEVDGGPNAVQNLAPSVVSNDNKEVLALLNNENQKLWGISEQRLGQTGGAEFATELQIQESGFQMKTSDLQEGLRQFLEEQGDCVKDIIWQLWDQVMWFKTTDKEWLKPEMLGGINANSPAEILTGDYHIKVDVSNAMRPNGIKDKKDAVEFMNIMTQPQVTQILQMAGVPIQVVIEAIKKVAEKYGVSPDAFEAQMPAPMPGQVMGQVPQEVAPEAPQEGLNAVV
jgi:hypothetical protein